MKLITLVKAAGLTKALSGKQKLTVFAPTNSAFAALKRKDPKLFAKVGHDPALLKQVLLASNGVIHAINSVLLPRLSAPPTVPVTG